MKFVAKYIILYLKEFSFSKDLRTQSNPKNAECNDDVQFFYFFHSTLYRYSKSIFEKNSACFSNGIFPDK